MKMIKFFFVLFLLCIIPTVFANDPIEWDESYIAGSYNESSETLIISSRVITEKSISEKYSFVASIGDEKCEGEYQYASFQLSGTCTFSIPKDEIEGAYKVEIIILNALNQNIEDFFLKGEVSGYESSFSWDDFETEVQYNNIKGDLQVSGKNCHPISEIYDGVRIDMGITEDHKIIKGAVYKHPPTFKSELSAKLVYNKETDCVEFMAKQRNVYSIGDQVGYVYEIYEDSEQIHKGVIVFTVREEDSGKDIDWRTFQSDYRFLSEEDTLYINLIIPNIEIAPSRTYTVELGGTTTKWTYNKEKQELYANLEVVHSRSNDGKKFESKMVVRGDTYQTLFDKNFSIRIDYSKTTFIPQIEEKKIENNKTEKNEVSVESNTSVEKTQEKTDFKEEKSVVETSPMQRAVDAYISRQQVKFPHTQDLKNNLILTTELLNRYASKNPKYKSVIQEINTIILNRVKAM